MPIVPLSRLEQFAAINVLTDPGAIPGPKIIPFCMQVVIRWQLDDGKVGHNVLGARFPASYPGTVTMANAIHTALTTGAEWLALQGNLGTTISLAGVTLRDINAANAPVEESTTAPVPGTGPGSLLPDEVAIAVTLRTANVGPANRGRFYVPGWVAGNVIAGNLIAATTVSALTAWANTTVRGAIGGQGLTWVLLQPARAAYTGSTGRAHPARAAGSSDIISALVRDNHWDSMRRRGLK